MNLFDQFVSEALKNQPQLSSLRVVVEKELLHHDILNTLSRENLITDLTFIGGTCLRTCYGSERLSEDLDFTGGVHFKRENLSQMAGILKSDLEKKYGLIVNISEPIKVKNNVDTWKIKIETRPKEKHIPSQRINIDICAQNSYERRPMLLLNPYGVDMGTSGLVIQAESKEEIYADKLVAFVLRPNRIKNRDLWDIIWLHQNNVNPAINLVPAKIAERKLDFRDFLSKYDARIQTLMGKEAYIDFKKEMQRFLPTQSYPLLNNEFLWSALQNLLQDLKHKIEDNIA